MRCIASIIPRNASWMSPGKPRLRIEKFRTSSLYLFQKPFDEDKICAILLSKLRKLAALSRDPFNNSNRMGVFSSENCLVSLMGCSKALSSQKYAPSHAHKTCSSVKMRFRRESARSCSVQPRVFHVLLSASSSRISKNSPKCFGIRLQTLNRDRPG